jgi:hypothetical protein
MLEGVRVDRADARRLDAETAAFEVKHPGRGVADAVLPELVGVTRAALEKAQQAFDLRLRRCVCAHRLRRQWQLCIHPGAAHTAPGFVFCGSHFTDSNQRFTSLARQRLQRVPWRSGSGKVCALTLA